MTPTQAVDVEASVREIRDARRNAASHHRAMLHHRAIDDAKITHCAWCDGWGWLGQCRTCGMFTPQAVTA